MENNSNEIDLIELYQKILVFISQRIFTFIIFSVLGLLVGFAVYYNKSKIIKTTYLAQTNVISNDLIYSLTDKIAYSIEKNDISFLEQNLNVDIETINSIKEISIDTNNNNNNIINISIISSSKETLLPFAKAIIHYFNNLPFIKEQIKSNIKSETFFLNKVNEEIENINKFQQKFLEDNKKGKVTINQISGSHSEKLQLYKIKQKYEEKLANTDAVKLINTSDNIVRNDFNLLKTLLISLISSIFAALFFLFIKFSIELKNRA